MYVSVPAPTDCVFRHHKCSPYQMHPALLIGDGLVAAEVCQCATACLTL